ncbi:MAG: M23 family metallopeptidase [Bacteroidota bacterium]
MCLKNYFFLFCLTLGLSVNAQNLNLLQIKEMQMPDGSIGIYAQNMAYCPLTTIIDFPVLKNMKADKALPYHAVIPARAEKYLILKVMDVKNPKGNSYEYRYSSTYYMGDGVNAQHDDKHIYRLPYETGKSTLVGQGYNGKFSHHNMNCLDFNLPENSKVLAARDGVVVHVKADSKSGCAQQKCKGQANFITLYHQDGTFGRYIHLKYRGSKVKVGQKIKAGEHIGWSGNTGWSSGPHLHFEVNRPGKNNMVYTVPTKFKLPNGKIGYLEEGESYRAVH